MKIDKNNYLRGDVKHSDLISRQLAHEFIYLRNRSRYPLPFNKYVIHHIDEKKWNNDLSNLQILTPEEHSKIHKHTEAEKKKDIKEERKTEKIRKKHEKELREEANKILMKRKKKTIRNAILIGLILIIAWNVVLMSIYFDKKEIICNSNYYDCGDFSTQEEAQKVFEACGKEDIHYLDLDDDGSACETLP